ncbi:MAG: 3-phosphoshikimate 1-carboxyvinyltransferase [Pontimonas sp.]|nr:3-phosphoshikimate 1-carboxyvinyltransferase [Pontimonas sp.]
MQESEIFPAWWPAPERARPLRHSLSLPGSKSLTNRELVLAALASGPSRIRRPLHSRDSALMVDALRALGATITAVESDGAFGPDFLVEPLPKTPAATRAMIDCGLAGTVMRFIPPVAALVPGTIHLDGDLGARRRPMQTTLDALAQLGVAVEKEGPGGLPFTMTPPALLTGESVTLDASLSSQFVSGLLLAAPRMPRGLTITHTGDSLPSLPHIDMTIASLRARGVSVESPKPGVWRVEPGDINPIDVTIEPDLSNAAPFLAAALISGGEVTLDGWPQHTTQVGRHVPELLELFGAEVHYGEASVTVSGGAGWVNGAQIPGVDLDLSHAGELAPTFIALSALADGPSSFRGIGHLRGHETDRLSALVSNIQALGGNARELPDGIEVTPTPLDGGAWAAFEDHRMATSGALLGLGVRGIVIDDIACTSKTLPEFVELWSALVESPAP